MFRVYIYVLDTMADWEAGYITAELNSRRFFGKNAPEVSVKTVSCSKDAIRSMGGLAILPDCLVGDIAADETSVLILPGANTWSEPKHAAVIEKARKLLSSGGTVCAICGATAALAGAGLLDDRPHTSNGAGFLEMSVPGYKGTACYVDEPSVTDDGLITAGCTGGLLWAKQIIARLGVFEADTLEAWYSYFSTGAADSFFALMKSLPSA